jgi:BirA family biotin operon repressor/biotin-[acetyl-CoA-carboxylase] ligase
LHLERTRSRFGVIGQPLHWLVSTGSTNDVAARLAERSAEEGTTVVAEMQTAGRGRHGRSWFSPPGAGLYVSVILRPLGDQAPSTSSAGPLITLASGVAIAEAIRSATGLPAEIKWPNDVMIARRKVAGILTESVAQAGAVQHTIVGFGVNLQPAAYPVELAPRVTSIEAETSRPADRGLLLAEILARLNDRCGDLRAGRFDAILGAWRRLAPSLRESPVEWETSAGTRRGRAEDIDNEGALLVRVDGRLERILAGEVRWL